MNENPSAQPRLALLIDADNISAKYLPIILNEIPRYGIATYRRIYGDFTDPQAAKWRSKLLDNSITPVQQFSNVKSHKPGEKAGKNATDSTLIIDAMDILYAGKVDGFIIVSSDSDFTRLAARLRESNMIVVGMGRNQTAISFRHACTKFVNIEYLYNLDQTKADDEDDEEALAGGDSIETTVALADVEAVVGGIIRNNDNRGRVTSLAEIGASLNNKFPDFDVRNFGYSQLSKLIDEFDRFELVKVENGYDVRIKETTKDSSEIFAFIIEELAKRTDKTMGIAPLATKVYKRFPSFNLKDTGYSQFYKFANSHRAIEVSGNSSRKIARLVGPAAQATPDSQQDSEKRRANTTRKPRRRSRNRKPAQEASVEQTSANENDKQEETAKEPARKRGRNREIFAFMVDEIGKRKNKSIGIAPLATKVRKAFPDFDLADTGYSHFYQFANNCKEITIVGEGRQRQAALL